MFHLYSKSFKLFIWIERFIFLLQLIYYGTNLIIVVTLVYNLIKF